MGTYQLQSIKETFAEAGSLYKNRAIPIFLVSLLSALLSSIVLAGGTITAFFSLGGPSFFRGDLKDILMNPAVIGSGTLLAFAVLLLITWCHAAVLTVTVRDDIDTGKGLITSWKYVFPLLWITSLYIGITIAGLTLLILPGLVLTLSMSLCFFIMVEEGRSGIDALLASRFYIRRHWWYTLLKFLLILIPACLIGIIPVAGPALLFLFTPFVLLYMLTVFHDLKECAEEAGPPTGTGWLWVVFGVFGLLLPLLAFIGTMVAFGPQLPEILKKAQTEINYALGTDIFPPENDTEKPRGNTIIKPPNVRQISSVDGFVIWRDPIGDAHSHLVDVKEVSVRGNQGKLILTTTMTRPFSTYFITVKPGDLDVAVISFHLDTDMDRATGGTPFGQQQGRDGYDMEVQVLLAPQQQGNKVLGGLEVGIYQVDGQERRFLGVLNKKTVTIAGDTVTVRLPYSQLKADPGNIIRMCYREAAQEHGRGLAKDKLVPLK